MRRAARAGAAEADADLVAITIQTYTARRAYEIADCFRARGIPVVAGGYHATFLPEEALAHADAVVVGDAEAVWPAVVRDARAGCLQRIYRGDGQPDLAGVVYDRAVFAGLGYRGIAAVQVGRGCRYACDFCSIDAFYGPHVRYRPPEAVAAGNRGDGAALRPHRGRQPVQTIAPAPPPFARRSCRSASSGAAR